MVLVVVGRGGDLRGIGRHPTMRLAIVGSLGAVLVLLRRRLRAVGQRPREGGGTGGQVWVASVCLSSVCGLRLA